MCLLPLFGPVVVTDIELGKWETNIEIPQSGTACVKRDGSQPPSVRKAINLRDVPLPPQRRILMPSSLRRRIRPNTNDLLQESCSKLQLINEIVAAGDLR